MLDEKTNEVKLPSNASLVIRASEEEAYVICEVCGAENETGKELCRVCSNYLDEEGHKNENRPNDQQRRKH